MKRYVATSLRFVMAYSCLLGLFDLMVSVGATPSDAHGSQAVLVVSSAVVYGLGGLLLVLGYHLRETGLALAVAFLALGGLQDASLAYLLAAGTFLLAIQCPDKWTMDYHRRAKAESATDCF